MDNQQSGMEVTAILRSDDPLSDVTCTQLIAHRREDDFVDFKQTFDPTSDRSWIDLAVDCVAFANTRGGFIVLGIDEKAWDVIGVAPVVASALKDPKRVLEKVNRNLNPALTRVKTRVFQMGGLDLVAIAIPPSDDCTHIFETNLEWSPTPKTSLTRVPKGAIYVRRAGSNQILTSSDFEELIGRRLARFREKVLEGITRVVQAPPEEEVVTVKATRDDAGVVELRIGSAPEGMELQGRSLKIAVNSVVDKIKLFRELYPLHHMDGPGRRFCLEAYVVRHSLEGEAEVAEWLAVQSLIDGLPAFRWLHAMEREDARKALRAAFAGATYRKEQIIRHAIFFGTGFYKDLRDRLVASGRQVGPAVRDREGAFGIGPTTNPIADAAAASALAQKLLENDDARIRHVLSRLDCSLYAPF